MRLNFDDSFIYCALYTRTSLKKKIAENRCYLRIKDETERVTNVMIEFRNGLVLCNHWVDLVYSINFTLIEYK